MKPASSFLIKSGAFGALSTLGVAFVRLRALWTGALTRFRGRLRPAEWVLLVIGAAALLMFIYVLWKQPVSRR